ncbi:MAG: glycosyltransferase family 39 protein [Planctomycetales bacterium]|nr:glycosyltransferase family 39 protein [Planctomycetales bacterium]
MRLAGVWIADPATRFNFLRPVTPESSLLTRPSIGLLMLAIGLTVIMRGVTMWMLPTSFQADPDAYRAISVTIAESGVFGLTGAAGDPKPTAFRPPLYPWMISFVVFDGNLSRLGLGCFHLVLASLTSCCVFLVTRRLARQIDHADQDRWNDNRAWWGDRLGVIAAILVAVDPILLRQSTEVMTETLATTLTTAVIWLWCRWEADENHQTINSIVSPAGLGVLLALAYLCRPTFLVWAILLIAATVFKNRNRRGIVSAFVMGAIVTIAVIGWTTRNDRRFGHPIWATTHGGYTLLLANNDSFYRYLTDDSSRRTSFWQAWNADEFLNAYQHRYEGDPRSATFWKQEWTGQPSYAGATSEYDDDRLCYEAAVATIKRQPAVFVWSAVVRVARLWSPFPHDVSDRSKLITVAVACFYIAIYAAASTTMIRQRRIVFGSRWWAIWLLAFTLSGVHAVYWSNLRMRAPVVPAIAVVAVFCFKAGHRRARNR